MGMENLASTGIRIPDRPVRTIVAIPTELFRPTHGLNMETNCSSDPGSIEEHRRKRLKVFVTKKSENVHV